MGLIPIILLIVLIIGLCLLLYMLREAFLNDVVRHEFLFQDFPETFGRMTIFFISDIHKRTISDKVIQTAIGKADFVVVGGDLTERDVPLQKVKANLRKLRQIGPVYFVWGNNDYEANLHQLHTVFQETDINVLDNSAVSLHSNQGEKIFLLGVDDVTLGRDRLELALDRTETNHFKILVSHSPDIIKKVGPKQNIRLILSGHTHGGQIRLFGFSPGEKGGIKRVQQTVLFISNGYGTTAIPLRLGAPAQCHLITVRNGTDTP